MTEDNILSYTNNFGSLILLQNNNYYDIYFKTSASYYYCINNCGSSRCRCKDKDWIQGTWNGNLLGYCKKIDISTNIFEYIKNNFDDLSRMDRKKLLYWFRNNIHNFINLYYSEKIILLKEHITSLLKIGIFNKDFYENLKNRYFKKYEEILNCKLGKPDTDIDPNIDLNTVYTICINNLNPIYINSSYDSLEINSLQYKCYDVIRYKHDTYQCLLEENKYIMTIDENNIDIKNILEYFRILNRYCLLGDFFHDFYEEYIKGNVSNEFNFEDTKTEIEYIIDIWNSITDTRPFSI